MSSSSSASAFICSPPFALIFSGSILSCTSPSNLSTAYCYLRATSSSPTISSFMSSMASSTISPTTPIYVRQFYLRQISLQVRGNRCDFANVGQTSHLAHNLGRVAHGLGQLDIAEDVIDAVLDILDLSLTYKDFSTLCFISLSMPERAWSTFLAYIFWMLLSSFFLMAVSSFF